MRSAFQLIDPLLLLYQCFYTDLLVVIIIKFKIIMIKIAADYCTDFLLCECCDNHLILFLWIFLKQRNCIWHASPRGAVLLLSADSYTARATGYTKTIHKGSHSNPAKGCSSLVRSVCVDKCYNHVYIYFGFYSH